MTNPDLARISNLTRVYLPGALDAVLVEEYNVVMNQFFQATNIWTTKINVPITAAIIALAQAAQAAAQASVPPMQVPPVTFMLTPPNAQTSDAPPVTYTGNIYQLMGLTNSNGNPVGATMGTIPVLSLNGQPSNVDTLVAVVALTVDSNVQGDAFSPCYPDWIANKYGDTILDGLVGRMKMQFAKPYSDSKEGALRTRSFNSALSSIRVEAARQNLYGAQAWNYPQGWQTRRRGLFM